MFFCFFCKNLGVELKSSILAFKHVLLVAVTGYGTPADRDKALKSGFDLHCVKPIDPEKLFQMFVPHMTSAPKSPPPEIALPSTVKRPF